MPSHIASISNEATGRTVEPTLRQFERCAVATGPFPKSFIVAAVTECEQLFASVTKLTREKRAEILNSIDEKPTYAEVMGFPSTTPLEENLTQKVVENVLRHSHTDQFEWLAKGLGIALTKGLGEWSIFIELTERRNLFAHGRGRDRPILEML